MSLSNAATNAFLNSLQLEPNPSMASSISDGEFLLLRSLSTGGAGAAAGSSIDDKVSGVSLLFIRSFANLCGGAVGSKGGTCICNASECNVTSHTKEVCWPCSEPALFLINKTRGNSVYLEPFLPVSLLSDDDEIAALLQEQISMDAWAERVSHYKFAARTGPSVTDASNELKLLKEALKTPTTKGSKRQADFEDSLAQLQLHSAKKPASVSPFLATIEEKITNLSPVLGAEEGQEQLAAMDLVPLIVDLAKEVQSLGTKESVQAEHVSASSDYIKMELADLNSILGAVNVDITSLKALVGPRLVDITLQGNIFEILQQMESILKLSGVIGAAVDNSPLVSQSLLTLVIMPYKTAIESLNKSVSVLENGHRGGLNQGTFPAPVSLHRAPGVAFSPSVGGGLDSWKGSIESQMEDLKRMCNNLGTGSETGVNFRGVAFANRGEMNAWLEHHEGTRALPISLFQCHVTLLHRMFTVIMGEHLDLKEAKAISDMKGAKKSNQIYTGVNTGGPKHRFGGIPTYECFDLPTKHDGMHYRSLEALDKVCRTCQHESESDAKSADVKHLANNMQTRSADFIKATFSFMVDTYQEYLGSIGDTKKTWDFVCECVEKIYTSEFQEARSLATGMDFNDPEFASKMIWCSLKITCVQEKFLEVGIANHLVLSSTCTHYLIKNTSVGNVETFRDTLNAQVGTISSMETTIAKLRNQVRSATSLADKANNGLKKLKEEVAKKKDK